MQELINLQHKLEAPKNKKNTFWNYNYRSTEDILWALKPLLMEEGCFLTLTDDIIQLGDRFYVKATATLTKGEKSVYTSAFARESLDKKWMDSSQITWSASSYARKYALNGLFAIDDTVDADWMDNSETWIDKIIWKMYKAQDLEELKKLFLEWMKLNPDSTELKRLETVKDQMKSKFV